MVPAFNQLYFSIHKTLETRFVGNLLALDPGETMGWSLFRCETGGIELVDCGQLLCTPLAPVGIERTRALITKCNPQHIAYEDYRVYNWKANQHSWSELHTPKLIGCIVTIAHLRDIPTSCELAQQPKNFVTDEKLEIWKMYQKGQRHARDSIRHGLFWLLFRDKGPKPTPVN